MELLSSLIFICIGSLVGFLSGLLGIGGGIIVVPALLVSFSYLGIVTDHSMQLATGTSLTAMVLTTSSSAWSHSKHHQINWSVFFTLIPGILLGAACGGVISHILPSAKVYLTFACFICLMGLYHLFPVRRTIEIDQPYNHGWLLTSGVGVVIGTLSSFFGIGGGIITVPLLNKLGMPLRNAISLSATTSFVIALAGALTFAYLGYHSKESIGYVHMPAFLCIGLSSIFTAWLGAKYARTLPMITLRRIFGSFMLAVGFAMFLFK